ncbi:MAG: thioredoxin [Victivallaceae bacterium]|nr:thioredoxin [Victivallaceae bacterium]
MSEVKHLNSENFAATVASGVTLVDFWAEWCGPCRMLGPILDKVAEEIGDDAIVAKVNVDESPQLSTEYAIRTIPAIFILKDGKKVNEFIGVKDQQTLVNAIKAAYK